MLMLGFLLTFNFISCSSDDDSANGNNPGDNSGTSEILTNGMWKVTLFIEDQNTETNHFSGYEFDFKEDHTLVANNGSTTMTGTWALGTDDSTNKLIIVFPSASDDSPFEEISEDWQILNRTDAKIELKHVSGGDATTDLLTFEKI